jgi:hypothetical protein
MKRLFVAYLLVGSASWYALFDSTAHNAPQPPSTVLMGGMSVFLSLACAVLISLAHMVARGLMSTLPAARLEAQREIVLASVPANHRVSIEARGGRLFVTNQALLFTPHRFNFSQAVWRTPLNSIVRVHSSSGLNVQTRDGVVHRFVVPQPTDLAARLAEMVEAPPDGRWEHVAAPWQPEPADRRTLTA